VLLSPWRTDVGKISLIRNASALNTNQTMEISRLLPALSVPTLILWGEDDAFQPVRWGERLARDIPGASLVRIAGARHFVMIDQPERVHRTIRDFLDQQVVQPQQAAA
jgi:pimeloyl-ACP methyl ester carboxylesterase